jgi:RNA polymerase sigma factor (sigma-70 family)
MDMKSEEFNKYLRELIYDNNYEKIFEAVKPFVYKHGREILGKYNLSNSWGNGLDIKNEWQEHMQNLYIEIYKCVNKFDPDKNTKFTFYAIVCIRNYFYNYSQKQSKIHTKEKSMESTINSVNSVNSNSNNSNAKMDKLLIDTFASDEEGPEEKCVNAERNNILASALKKLNNKQKRFIYYYYSERMPMTEIAELFGQTYASVRYLRDKTLEELRGELNREM